MRQIIAAYSEAFKARYNTNPLLDGKARGCVKRLVLDEGLGISRIIDLVQSYLQMNDAWFLTKNHDLSTFEANLNKVSTFDKTGLQVNRTIAQQLEKQQASDDLFDEYARLQQQREKEVSA